MLPEYEQQAASMIAAGIAAAMRAGLPEDEAQVATRQAIEAIGVQIQDVDHPAGSRPRVIYAGRLTAAWLAVRLDAAGHELAPEVRAAAVGLIDAPDMAGYRKLREVADLAGPKVPGLAPLARALGTTVSSAEHAAALAHVTRDVMRNRTASRLDDLYQAWCQVVAPSRLVALAEAHRTARQVAVAAVAAGYPKIDVARWANTSRTTLDTWLTKASQADNHGDAWRYGALLALCAQAARHAGVAATNEAEKEFGRTLAGQALHHKWVEASRRWMRSPNIPDDLRERIAEAEAGIVVPVGWLSVRFRADIMTGYHASMARAGDPR